MLRRPAWTSAAVSASLVAIVAIAASQTAHADSSACLPAPGGATPKGQHWYYHLDRPSGRKCWYLHETIATHAAAPPAAQQSAAPSAPASGGNEANASAAPRPPVKPAAPTTAASPTPPAGATPAPPEPSDNVAPDTAAPAQAASDTPQQQPTTSTSPPHADAIWTGSVPATAAGVHDVGATAASPAANEAADDTPATGPDQVTAGPKAEAAAAPPETAPAPEDRATHSVVENLLVIGFAAVLAGAVSIVFVAIRRRRSAAAKSDDVLPRFGSRADRWSVDSSQTAEHAPQSAPIESSLIPEQLLMTRPSAVLRRQERPQREERDRPPRVPLHH